MLENFVNLVVLSLMFFFVFECSRPLQFSGFVDSRPIGHIFLLSAYVYINFMAAHLLMRRHVRFIGFFRRSMEGLPPGKKSCCQVVLL